MSVRPSTRHFPLQRMGSLAALSLVRQEFTDWVSAVAGADGRTEELSVVLSELGANAVQGTPAGVEPATATAWVDGSQVTIEVTNHVGAVGAGVDWDLDDPLRTGGRGLLLVSAFVDDIEVDVDGDVLLVRCRATV